MFCSAVVTRNQTFRSCSALPQVIYNTPSLKGFLTYIFGNSGFKEFEETRSKSSHIHVLVGLFHPVLLREAETIKLHLKSSSLSLLLKHTYQCYSGSRVVLLLFQRVTNLYVNYKSCRAVHTGVCIRASVLKTKFKLLSFGSHDNIFQWSIIAPGNTLGCLPKIKKSFHFNWPSG